MPEQFQRTIYYYKNYFWDFYSQQKPEVKKKINWVLGFIEGVRFVPEKFLKHIEGGDGLYEIRVKVGSDIFRVFSFFEEGNLIVVINGFQKKSDKIPRNEIVRAERIRKEYYDEKAKS